jgi:hypothetical protein
MILDDGFWMLDLAMLSGSNIQYQVSSIEYRVSSIQHLLSENAFKKLIHSKF